MKKLFTILASFAVLCCLGLVSCQGDYAPDYRPSSIDPERTAEQVFWGVVGQLVGKDLRTSDYEGKTFKPTIGEPNGSDESVRIVAVNSLEAAVERFNTLVGADITPETKSYTYKSKEVGTLIWNLSSDNTCWATVDASVPSVPSLQKIIYRSAEQGDVNGSVDGSAYYRFGDVLHRETDDGLDEYWICVRPSFGPEGKGKSHWVCVSELPKANLWPYYKDNKPFTASNGFTYSLPYNLGTDIEWHQDLAEMLFAIMYPTDWFTNIGKYYTESMFGSPNGMPIFNDWHNDDIRLHNIDFWKNVQKQWKDKNLVQKIFGISYDEMAKAIAPDGTGRGIHLIYDEYDWNTITSNKPKLFQVHYNHGTKNTEQNMHKRTKTTVQAQVVKPKDKTESNINYSFDFYKRMMGDENNDYDDKPYVIEQRYFGDAAPRWCVRYAEGAELSNNKKYDPQLPISGFTAANEEYRYYKDVFPDKNLTDEPEETQPAAAATIVNDRSKQNLNEYDGESFYRIGDVYKDENGHRWIVVRPSGGSAAENPWTEKTPVTELVSFEGITFSQDKKIATNIVQRDQLIRVAFPLWFLVQEIHKKWASFSAGNRIEVGPVYNNIKNNAGVDLRHLMQELSSTRYNDSSAETGGSEMCSFAYYYYGNTTDQQLMRYIVETDNKNAFHTVMYDVYPLENVVTNNYPGLTPAQFSGDGIRLSYIADAQKVSKYANDFFAQQSITGPNGPQRSIRTSPDARATDASNYVYNLSTWTAGTQPVGMWNEPVVLMRGAIIYDRGPEHATQTFDGHTLTLVSKGGHDDEWTNPYAWFQSANVYNAKEFRHLVGNNMAIPTWRSAWL